MRKFSLKEKMSYRIDELLSKGTGVLILTLFLITAAIVLAAGSVMALVDSGFAENLLGSIWNTFMYALDPGTLAGYTNNFFGVLALFSVTLCGIFITSMLIGVLSAGLVGKLESLKKGNSRVLVQNHTVIIGYDENTFVMLRELITANESRKKAVIVVLGEEDKMTMEHEITRRIPDCKTTEIICRTGSESDLSALMRCSVGTARSIIINSLNDAKTIKSILAVAYILNGDEAQNPTAHITAGIHEESNVEVAKIAGAGRVEVLYFKSAVARMIANTCHQTGLSRVYTELFNFTGDEIYIENIHGVEGKTFGEVINLFDCSTVLGIKKGKVIKLNPPKDTQVELDDQLILLAADNGVSTPMQKPPIIDKTCFSEMNDRTLRMRKEYILVLGVSDLLPDMLEELDSYVSPGTIITVGTQSPNEEISTKLKQNYKNMTVQVEIGDIYSDEVLSAYVEKGYHKMIVLSRKDCDPEESDAKNLMILLHLKAISERKKVCYSVVSQMLSPQNGELAKIASVNDFVISTNLTALILSQISEDRSLAAIFDEILDAKGSELYMKPADLYIKIGQPVTLYTVSDAVMQQGEILVGYKTVHADDEDGTGMQIVTNPNKADTVVFTEDDWLIVLSKNG
ncbi:MAG: hypothetical protein RR225_09390 [Clostridium sp.]